MRFWDSSAVVPLVLEEATSPQCRDLLRAGLGMQVWTFTRVEVVSAIRRKERAGETSPKAIAAALGRLERLASYWSEVVAIEPVRARALRALGVHALTAADALQLGAALELRGARAGGFLFIAADEVLELAARREGFATVLVAPPKRRRRASR